MTTMMFTLVAVGLLGLAATRWYQANGGGGGVDRAQALMRLWNASSTPFILAGLAGITIFLGVWPSATLPIIRHGWWLIILAVVAVTTFGWVNVPTEEETREARRRIAKWYLLVAVVLLLAGLAYGLWSAYGSTITIPTPTTTGGGLNPIEAVASRLPLPDSESGVGQAVAVTLLLGGVVVVLLFALRWGGARSAQWLVATGAVAVAILLAGYGIQRELAGSVGAQKLRESRQVKVEKVETPSPATTLVAPPAPSWSDPISTNGRKLVRVEGSNWVVKTQDGQIWGPGLGMGPAPNSPVEGARFQTKDGKETVLTLTWGEE